MNANDKVYIVMIQLNWVFVVVVEANNSTKCTRLDEHTCYIVIIITILFAFTAELIMSKGDARLTYYTLKCGSIILL